MNRLTSSVAALAAASLSQGCTISHLTAQTTPARAGATAALVAPATVSPGRSCVGPQCAAEMMRVAHKTEVPVEKQAPALAGHPLTSVVVTQCNLIVAVYMTMPDGKLLRYDHSASIPAEQLLQMAYTATRSE
ncbi:MAG: hypothetical protein JWN85_3914, partial [Gammaproteobacteria bacterium]|nr:hypothetical protein [Gammaproteobacteria bacterium]